MLFRDRQHAGRMLAAQLKNHSYVNPVVIALPRGGIPVGVEVARTLRCPLDILVVRKLGHPSHPEFGIGAIAEGGEVWLDPHTVEVMGLSVAEIDRVVKAETRELERRVKKYRGGRPFISVRDCTAIVVDDGLATGVTAKVAAQTLHKLGAREVVIAVPVCAPQAVPGLRAEIDEIVAVNRPHLFRSVGQYYVDFPQLRDEEVLRLLP